MNMQDRQAEITAQREEWSDKLKYVPGSKRNGYAHFESIIEVLAGDPSDDVLLNFADDWGWNFGGEIRRRWKEDDRRFVRVKVYTD